MANTSKGQSPTSPQPGGTQKRGVDAIGSPISNEAYNVITALQAKLEGLEAYRKYAKDNDEDLWRRLTQSELESVGVLVAELEKMVTEGRFRMH